MKKFALVTGASGGIGRAISYKLASEGYSLYLHYNQGLIAIEKLIEEINGFGGEYIPIKADLSKKDGYKKIASNTFSIDEIIYCSGTSHYGLIVDIEQSTVETLLHIHVSNLIMLSKELLPKMISKNQGNIVVISSIWGQTGAACEVAYSAAKGAQISFVKALSKEYASNGIRVNSIAPGAIKTEMLSTFSKEELDEIRNDIPMGKLGRPEDVADTVSFLLSKSASYITGQVIPINGGWYS